MKIENYLVCTPKCVMIHKIFFLKETVKVSGAQVIVSDEHLQKKYL